MEGQGLLVLGDDVAQTGADVDVALGPELLQFLLDTWVLAEGLDEGADGVLHGQPHLALELGETTRLEALLDPALVVVERELGHADEKVVWTEAVERLQPAVGSFQVACEDVDVRRARSHDPPTEDSDPFHDISDLRERCW